MTSRLARAALAAALACGAPALRAQQPPALPVRPIGPILAVSHDTLASVAAAVQVGGGRVYVNDITAHRVLLYDSTLGSGRVIVDSGGSAADAYGSMPGTLLPYHRDSALLVTPASLAMLVLSPEGTIARVLAMPPSGTRGLPSLIGNIFGTPGFDAAGRLAYFSPVRMTFRGPPPDGGAGMSFQPPDSALIVRFDFAARTVDTVGAIRIPRTSMSMNRDDQGRMHMSMTALPLATVDDWAVTSDGRIAVVRGRDYHVDWLGADGAWTSTPRVPFAWEQLDDARKQVLIDSAVTAMQTAIDSMLARSQRNAGPVAGAGGAVIEGRQAAPGSGGGGTMIVTVAPPGGGGPPGGGPGGGGRPTGAVSVTMAAPTIVKAALADVPDYRPAFRQGAVRADAEGGLWIRTSAVVDGRPVYDVVDGRGELTDRVQLPPFRTVAGFGPGVVYMAVQDSSGTAHLERARIR